LIKTGPAKMPGQCLSIDSNDQDIGAAIEQQ
jgi:hypothetical protein